VQGGSVIKPLVGVENDAPSDAAVIRPVLGSCRGLAISCGMNPYYGDIDTYHMAASAIDEAVRNCVAVGARPDRIAILDNFCWGYTDRPETLGSLVRAALACHDVAVALGTPFISGKDSLNNEFSYTDEQGVKQTVSIPPSLLISAMGHVDDVRRCVTMDFKEAGNRIYLVGLTRDELGGSHFALVEGLEGGDVPKVRPHEARKTFAAVHAAIQDGLVRACHDLSEGGLAVALAEMAFAGRCGARVQLEHVPHEFQADGKETPVLLFSESNSRFLCEVPADKSSDFEAVFRDLTCADIGEVTDSPNLEIADSRSAATVVNCAVSALKEAWQAPLRW
jgi:phosphoribosylformylglycinamidine synthase